MPPFLSLVPPFIPSAGHQLCIPCTLCTIICPLHIPCVPSCTSSVCLVHPSCIPFMFLPYPLCIPFAATVQPHAALMHACVPSCVLVHSCSCILGAHSCTLMHICACEPLSMLRLLCAPPRTCAYLRVLMQLGACSRITVCLCKPLYISEC